MSTSGATLRWPQRARRSTIHCGVFAWVLTLRTTRPEKRPHRSGASIFTASLSCTPTAAGVNDWGLSGAPVRSEEHTSELQSPCNLVCRLLLEKKKNSHAHLARKHHNYRERSQGTLPLASSLATARNSLCLLHSRRLRRRTDRLLRHSEHMRE